MICVDRLIRLTTRGQLAEASDELLLRQYVATRDVRFFDQLVHRYKGEMYDYLKHYLGDAQLAQDALQGTWLQLHLKCGMFDPRRKLRSWLYTIAVHQAIDVARSQRRHRMLSLDRPLVARPAKDVRVGDRVTSRSRTVAEVVERQETRDQVRQAVNRLPAHLRQLVGLVFFDGLKYREAAQALCIPEGTVKSRMHAAFERLRLGLDQPAN